MEFPRFSGHPTFEVKEVSAWHEGRRLELPRFSGHPTLEVKEVSTEPGELHLLVRLPPDAAPSAVVRSLKSRSSRLLRREFGAHLRRFFWKPGLWSYSYCILSCGGAPLNVIRQYIEQQSRPLWRPPRYTRGRGLAPAGRGTARSLVDQGCVLAPVRL